MKSQKPGRLIAIGDVHGCIHALDALLGAMSLTAHDQLIFLGDLIDQGPDTREVLNRIIELRQQCDVVLIQGNHEEMLNGARNNEQALRYWEVCGGVATLNSYRFGGGLAEIPAEHWALLGTCRTFYETDKFIFTHANYLPDVAMDSQPEFQLRWALFEREKTLAHFSGKHVFVGHTQQLNGKILDLEFATCIDTACCRYGWLTAIDVRTKCGWQANRWGALRDPGEPTQRSRLSELLRRTPA
jgi:serine/threonine protein phosphatase 1